MSNEPVPFLDLVTPHRALEEELVEAFRQALRSAAFVGGAQVEAFEREFAAYCGSKYCVGVANGTDAVRFSLMASGVTRADAVVTVSHTFIATVEAISQSGAQSARDMGQVMKVLMPEVKGRADGKLVNQVVKRLLN